MVPSCWDKGYQTWELMKQNILCSFLSSFPHSCFLLVWTFPKRRGMVSSAFNILFLSLFFFSPVFSYSGLFWSHQTAWPFSLQTAWILLDISPVCSSFVSGRFYYLHVFLHFFFFFLITIPQGLLFVYVSYSVLQSAIRGISVSQIAHCCWLCTFNVLLPGF